MQPHPDHAVPLNALDAVVLDTETTGLDAATARIVQIGAMRLDGPTIQETSTFETLINPGVPIPASSTAIHGISDIDVSNAPRAAEALPALLDYLRQSVIVGHTIHYDFTILRKEADRADVPWGEFRALDVRVLARIVTSTLADYSLDGLCDWKGIEIEGRHSAMGDVVATAKLFALLVSDLRRKGIRTLADAETASRAITEQEAVFTGVDVRAAAFEEDADETQALERIDSFPYRHRVQDVMSAPAEFVAPDVTLGEVNDRLLASKISSVFVTVPSGELGILTERDILRALSAEGPHALELPAGRFASAPLHMVSQDAFVYRAIGRVQHLGIRHLGVNDQDGNLVGALTTRNLLRHRAGTALILGDETRNAADVSALSRVWAQVPLMARKLLDEDVDPRDISAVISSEIRMLTRRAAQLAEQEMHEAGQGDPPVPYAVLILGSAGRGESLLAADQDNAIVYQHGEAGGIEDKWFETLGSRIADILDEAGIPYCTGGVMAKNPAWRKSAADWHSTVDGWVQRQRPEDLLNVDIFFDCIPVHGDHALGNEVWQYAYDRGRKAPAFIRMLSEILRDWQAPLTLFGNLRKLPSGRLDLKKGGLMPIFTAARILAIKTGVLERSTPGRLRGAASHDVGNPEQMEDIADAHRMIMKAMLMQQIRDLENGVPLSSRVDPNQLKKSERKNLCAAIRRVASVIDLAREGVH